MKKVIATVLAASLAFTAIGSAPARAEMSRDDVAAAIFGLAFIAGLASAMNNRDDDRNVDDHDGRRMYALPAECLREYEGTRRDFTGFGRRCLNRNGVNVNRLPERCERDVMLRRGWGVAYPQRCLEREGFFIANNRRRH